MFTDHQGSNTALRIKVAVASQNRRSVTAHAGRCRRFWIYESQGDEPGPGHLLELDKESTLHALRPGIPEALKDIDILIAEDLCANLRKRLERNDIDGVVSAGATPEAAVREVLAARAQMA